jgi:uncharacterized protein (TIGR00661 family)
MKILYYISGHGFGHISRSYEICKELATQENITNVTISSARIDFIQDPHPKIQLRKILMDVGIYQKNSISLDIEKTRHALEEFEKGKQLLLENEVSFAKKENFDLIISDSASLPLVLAVELKIPSIYIGNFTWDFIYRNYEKNHPYFGVISRILAVEYSFASSAIQLPFSCPMEGFLEQQSIGLVGRKPNLTKEQARKNFQFSKDFIYFLFSFGAYGLHEIEFFWENKPKNWIIVGNNLPGIESKEILSISTDQYPDLVTAADYVVTKPGYGIISEAILCNTPILYTDRGDFAEYDTLVTALNRYHPSAYLTQEQIRNFDFEAGIEKCKSEIGTKEKIETNGTEMAVSIIQSYL